MEQQIQLPPLAVRLEQLSKQIEKVALKIIKFQKIQKESQKYTLQQYYYFKEEIMELIADVSTQIEEQLPVEERHKSLDSRLIVDSFNEQIDKMKRICEGEESLEYLPSAVPVIKNQSDAKVQSDQKKKEEDMDFEGEIENFDIQREKARTIAILKLAEIDHEGKGKPLSEHEVEAMKHITVALPDEELHDAEDDQEEAKAEGKKKKKWRFNPIRSLIIKPVGTVLKVPGKIVGAVVNTVTHKGKCSAKPEPQQEPITHQETDQVPEETEVQQVASEEVVKHQSIGSKIDKLVFKRIGKLTSPLFSPFSHKSTKQQTAPTSDQQVQQQ